MFEGKALHLSGPSGRPWPKRSRRLETSHCPGRCHRTFAHRQALWQWQNGEAFDTQIWINLGALGVEIFVRKNVRGILAIGSKTDSIWGIFLGFGSWRTVRAKKRTDSMCHRWLLFKSRQASLILSSMARTRHFEDGPLKAPTWRW